MLTLLLIAILLTLLFGTAWLSGLFRNLALVGALFCASVLLKRLGVPLESAFYIGLGLLAILGGAATYWLSKVEAERKGEIAAARKRPENMILK